MGLLPERIVDFHVHLFPDAFFDAIWKSFVRDYKWGVIYHLYYRECVDLLRQNGVGPIVYSNYAHREGVAKVLNEWNLRVLDEVPDCYCFAAFHPGDADGLRLAERILDHPGVLGFKLQLLVQRFHPWDRRLYPLYDLVRERGKRILFHVGTGPVGNEFVGLAGFMRVLGDYPDLPATVAHMGALEYDGFMALLDDHPDLYFDTAFSFIPGFECTSHISMEELERRADRILYGSDFPNLIVTRETEIEQLVKCNFSDGFYRKIFYENGMRLIRRHAGSNRAGVPG
jgi:uncharacterized protein